MMLKDVKQQLGGTCAWKGRCFCLRRILEYRNNTVLIKKCKNLVIARKCNVKGQKRWPWRRQRSDHENSGAIVKTWASLRKPVCVMLCSFIYLYAKWHPFTLMLELALLFGFGVPTTSSFPGWVMLGPLQILAHYAEQTGKDAPSIRPQLVTSPGLFPLTTQYFQRLQWDGCVWDVE